MELFVIFEKYKVPQQGDVEREVWIDFGWRYSKKGSEYKRSVNDEGSIIIFRNKKNTNFWS